MMNQPASKYHLSDLGLLKISGPGALKLLQGQLSCDMDAVTSQNGSMGAHCNPQGRIISLSYVTKMDNDYFLVMPERLMAIAMAALKKYAPFFKAEINDVSKHYQIIGAQESSGHSAVIALPSQKQRKIFLMPAHSEKPTESYAAWQLLDLLEGIPAIYPETSGEFLPHDLNLPELNAVSFTKGCFTGQEIIARMHYRGKPKKHLYRGLSQDRLTPGALLYLNENPAATVIDCSQNVYNDHYVLLFTTDQTTAESGQLCTEQGRLIELLK
jgi:folate-binding protein YgfZ